MASTCLRCPRRSPWSGPRIPEHGDYASNLALQLGKKVGANPRELAGWLAEALAQAADGIAAAEVAGPGFINLRLEASAQAVVVNKVIDAGERFGASDALAGHNINLEFVSANPTGPIHIGGTRWAAVGDALGRLLTTQGAAVEREYYFNDHGTQIDRFASSLIAAAKGEPTPEDGYAGSYIVDIAADVLKKAPDALSLPDAEMHETFREIGVDLMFTHIKESLHEFGTDFDVYTHEDSMHTSGLVDQAIAKLRENGNIYEKDGATWLRTSAFGDDKDRVVIKSDGKPAYIAGDIAYYLDKRQRGFDLCIYMLGADHHGYIARLKAVAAAFGDDPATVEVLIGQMVNLVRDGQPVRMSKRAGTVITLDDLVEAIGVDAARYSMIRSSVDTPIDIDLALWSSASNENPVYYVQYAHARLSALARSAAELGLDPRHRAPRAAQPRQRGHVAAHHRRIPAGAGNGCVPAGTTPGVPVSGRPRPVTTTGSTTRAECCRRATSNPPICTPRVWRCARPPARSSPTVWRYSA